jgi:hypothetical protein
MEVMLQAQAATIMSPMVSDIDYTIFLPYLLIPLCAIDLGAGIYFIILAVEGGVLTTYVIATFISFVFGGYLIY